MSFTLSNMIYGALSSLGQTVEEAISASGSTTTSVSAKLSGKFNDDDLVGGTLFVLRDAGGAGAAPEAEFGAITANADSGTALTITHDAITVATAAGDRIGVSKPQYSLQTMIQRANDALRNIGLIPLPDTSLTTLSNTTEYALPVALKRAKLLRVEFNTSTISTDYQWETVPFRVVPSSPGSTGLLILPHLPISRTLKITYLGQHSAVNAFSDVISEYIFPTVAVKALEVEALNWLISSKGQSATNFELQRLNKAMQEYEQEKALHSVLVEQRQPKFSIYKEPTGYLPPTGTVRL